jgi:hypothetical protein
MRGLNERWSGTALIPISCGGAPAGATCTINPSSLALSGTNAANATVTMTTTTKTMDLPQGRGNYLMVSLRAQPSLWGLPLPWLVILEILAFVGALSSSRRARRTPAPAWALAAVLLVVSVWAACGGGGGGPPPPPPAPGVSLSPSSLTFSSQNLGTTSATQAVTLTNTGNATLSVTSIALTGADSGDFAQTNTCGSSVSAGANCQINVTFSPTAIGTRTGSVTITDNATGSPQTVSLTGTGMSPPTPPGTYNLTVTASLASGASTLMHKVTLTLTVN